MTNERLEFLRRWYQDAQDRETVWQNLRYCPPTDDTTYGIPYTLEEIDYVLAGLRVQQTSITAEIKASREDLR